MKYDAHAQATARIDSPRTAKVDHLDGRSVAGGSNVKCLLDSRIVSSESSGLGSRSCIRRGEYDVMTVRDVSANCVVIEHRVCHQQSAHLVIPAKTKSWFDSLEPASFTGTC